MTLAILTLVYAHSALCQYLVGACAPELEGVLGLSPQVGRSVGCYHAGGSLGATKIAPLHETKETSPALLASTDVPPTRTKHYTPGGAVRAPRRAGIHVRQGAVLLPPLFMPVLVCGDMFPQRTAGCQNKQCAPRSFAETVAAAPLARTGLASRRAAPLLAACVALWSHYATRDGYFLVVKAANLETPRHY